MADQYSDLMDLDETLMGSFQSHTKNNTKTARSSFKTYKMDEMEKKNNTNNVSQSVYINNTKNASIVRTALVLYVGTAEKRQGSAVWL